MLVNLTFAAAATAVANPVSVDWWTLILQSINLLVVMGVLYFLLFKPIAGVIQKRERFVEDSLAHAANSKEEADRLLAEYQEQLKEARTQAQEIIAKAANDAEEYARRKRQEADQEAQDVLAKAKREIELEREKALSAIRDEVATLAVAAAGRVLNREITKDDHKHLVDDFINKVGELN